MALLDQGEKHSKLLDILQPGLYIPIIDSLTQHLTIADVLILAQVCRELGSFKTFMLKKVSNINKRLEGFISAPAHFRSKLGQYGALISGDFARGLFDLKPMNVIYLDVVIRDGADAEQLGQHLTDNEGYSFEAETTIASTPTARQFTYINSSRVGGRLRMIRTTGSPIQHILTSSYTTACVNIATWNKAFSIFPSDTLVKHQFYPLQSFDDNFGSRLKELAQRGWTTRDLIWPDLERARSSRLKKPRRVGDTSSLVISLDTNAVSPSSTPDFVIGHAQFQVVEGVPRYGLFGQPQRLTSPSGSFLTLKAQEMTCASVLYAYTTGNTDWWEYLQKRLRRWGWLEAFKIGVEGTTGTRPSFNAVPLDSEIPNVTKPETWDYADDQIPKWYTEWEGQAKR